VALLALPCRQGLPRGNDSTLALRCVLSRRYEPSIVRGEFLTCPLPSETTSALFDSFCKVGKVWEDIADFYYLALQL
jgi:hypothetical protein